MKCTWCIQTNLNRIESKKIIEACDNLGYPHIPMKVVPFTSRCPRVKVNGPFVLIGSTTLNANALKSRKYKKGIFFNKKFTPKQYAIHYGSDYLNANYQVYKLKNIPDNLYDPDTNLFIRSNDDSKQISGGTVFFKELLELKKNTEKLYINGDIFNPDSEIFISTEKEIGREFRFIVVDKQVIAGSQYRPYIVEKVPDYVWDFAKNMAKI